MPVPNLERRDEPTDPPQPAAGGSLDKFAVEASKPSSRPLQGSLSEELTIIDLEKAPAEDPLDVFATEQRVEPLPYALERSESVKPLERPARRNRSGRRKRSERPVRFERFVGLVALAAVAIITVGALNWLWGFVTLPEVPALARVKSPPVAPAAGANDTMPKATDRLGAFSKPIVAPPKESVVAPRKEPADVPTRTAQPPSPPAPFAPSPAVNEPPRALARLVDEPPSRAALTEILTPRARESTPPAQVPTSTTGVAAAEVRGEPSASTPIVSTLGTTAAPRTTPEAAPAPPSFAATAASLPGPSAAAATRAVVPRAAVESVLGRYASAFSSLDARSAKAVWPSVNQRNLERAFESLEQQDFDLGACDISVLPSGAVALCNGTARYTPRVGNRKERTEARRWTFRLTQNGQDWSIESVESR